MTFFSRFSRFSGIRATRIRTPRVFSVFSVVRNFPKRCYFNGIGEQRIREQKIRDQKKIRRKIRENYTKGYNKGVIDGRKNAYKEIKKEIFNIFRLFRNFNEREYGSPVKNNHELLKDRILGVLEKYGEKIGADTSDLEKYKHENATEKASSDVSSNVFFKVPKNKHKIFNTNTNTNADNEIYFAMFHGLLIVFKYILYGISGLFLAITIGYFFLFIVFTFMNFLESIFGFIDKSIEQQWNNRWK